MNTKLRLIRLQQRISQWELAKETGVGQSRISLYENDLMELNTREKEAIAKALECSLNEIFPNEDEQIGKHYNQAKP